MTVSAAMNRLTALHLHRASSRARNVALAGLSLLAFITLVLLARRTSGELAAPIQPAVLWLAAAALALAAASIHLLSGKSSSARVAGVEQREPPAETAPPSGLFLQVGVTATIAIAGLALSWPVQAAAGTAGLWMILLAGEIAGWTFSRFRLAGGTWRAGAWGSSEADAPARAGAGGRATRAPRGVESAGGFASLRPPAPAPTPLHAAPHDEAEIQQLTRRRLPGGGEQIEGWLAAELNPAQRTTALHVAFCPPLEGIPAVSVRQLAGPPARLRVVQSLPFGAKIEVKLESAASEQAVVRVAITASPVAAAGRLPSGSPG